MLVIYKKTLFLFILLFLLNHHIFSQSQVGKPVSPAIGSIVNNGELLIIYDFKIDILWCEIFIDDVIDVTNSIKQTGKRVSLIYTDKLKTGSHTIFIHIVDRNQDEWVTSWYFMVGDKKYERRDSVHEQDIKMKNSLKISGEISYNYKIDNITGDGSFLRNDHMFNQELYVNTQFYNRKIEIPVQVYLTGYQDNSLQSRNYFMTGIKHRNFGLLAGYVSPAYHRLILGGSRILGFDGYVSLGKTDFRFTSGYVTNPIEGSLQKYNNLMGNPPGNMNPDSTYNVPGTYRRHLYAFDLARCSNDRKRKLHLTFLKSADEANSIKYGGAVAENAVIGLGYELKVDKSSFDIGLALSMTTDDSRMGKMSKDDIENLFGRSISFNPGLIMTLNNTTKSFLFYKYPFPNLSAYLDYSFRLFKYQRINFRFDRVGSSYYSFGNPYLLNDRQKIHVDDQVYIWKRKIILAANYEFILSNLSQVQYSTYKTQTTGGRLVFAPKPKLPRLFFNYRYYQRIRITDDTLNTKNTDMLMNYYTAGIDYSLKTGKFNHSINISGNYNVQKINQINPQTFFYDFMDFSLNELFPLGFYLSLYYDYYIINNTENNNNRNGYSINCGYSTKSNKFKIGLSFRQNRTTPFETIAGSYRTSYSGNIQYTIFKGLTLAINGGYSLYEEINQNTQNYKEFFGVGSAKYLFQ